MKTNLIGIAGCIGSGKNTVAKMIQGITAGYAAPNILRMIEDSEYEGKDTLQLEDTDWEIKSFAFKIKQIVSLLTGVTIEQLENREFKEQYVPDEWKVWIVNPNDPEGSSSKHYFSSKQEAEYAVRHEDGDLNIYDYTATIYPWNPTYREMFRYIGTDLFRNQFHPLTWVNALFAHTSYHIRCDMCMWHGYEDDLHPGWENTEYFRGCPHCKTDAYLMDIIPDNWIISDVRFPEEVKAIKDRGGKIIKLLRNADSEDQHPSEKYVRYIKPDFVIDNRMMPLEDLFNEVHKFLYLAGMLPEYLRGTG